MVELPVCVKIANVRLLALHYFLTAAVVVFSIWNFFEAKKHTRSINNNLDLTVYADAWGLARMAPCDEVCSADVVSDSGWAGSHVCRRCRTWCSQENQTRDYHQCLTGPEEMAEYLKSDDVRVFLSRQTTHLGPNVSLPDAFGLDDQEPDDDDYYYYYPSFDTVDIFTQASDIILRFSYKYRTEAPAPYVFGLNSDFQQSGGSALAITIVIDRNGIPYKTFGPNVDIDLSVPEVVYITNGHYEPWDTFDDLALFLEIAQGQGTLTDLPHFSYFTGLTVYGEVECYTDDDDLRTVGSRGVGSSEWNVGASLSTPVCLIRFSAGDAWDEVVTITKVPGLTTKTYIYGMRMICMKGMSFHRVWDFSDLLLHLVAALVFLRLPKTIVRFIALYLLGELSQIYRRAIVRPFHMTTACRRAIVDLVVNTATFVNLADTSGPENESFGGITFGRVLERVRAAMRYEKQFDEGELCALAGAAHDFTSDSGKFTLKRFLECRLSGEVHFDDVTAFFDKGRRRGVCEKLFTPTSLGKYVHSVQGQVHTDSVTGNHVASLEEQKTAEVLTTENFILLRKEFDNSQATCRQMHQDLDNLLGQMKKMELELALLRSALPQQSEDSKNPLKVIDAEDLVEDLAKMDVRIPDSQRQTGAPPFDFGGRISKLEQLLGQPHEPLHEEHDALIFDVQLLGGSAHLSTSQLDHYCREMVRKLSCDHVEILRVDTDSAVFSTMAIGFVDSGRAKVAQWLIEEGKITYHDGKLSKFAISRNVTHKKHEYCPSFQLRLLRQEAWRSEHVAVHQWHDVHASSAAKEVNLS